MSNVKMTMFVFIVELGFLVMAIIVSYEAHGASNRIPSSHHSWHFRLCNYDLSSLNHLLNCNSFKANQVEMLGSKFDFDYI
jgi:hypothetical protein